MLMKIVVLRYDNEHRHNNIALLWNYLVYYKMALLGTVRLPWRFVSALLDCCETDEAEDKAPPQQVAKL